MYIPNYGLFEGQLQTKMIDLLKRSPFQRSPLMNLCVIE